MKNKLLFFFFFYYLCSVVAQKDTIYTINHNAKFVTGNRGFSEFWSRHFKPSFKDRMKKHQGEGVLRFTVLRDGRVTNVMIVKGLSETLDEAAIKAMKESPNWLPAMEYGVPVDSDQEMSFWLDNVSPANPNALDISEAEKYVHDRGFAFELYLGGGIQSKPFNTFFRSSHMILGLGILYNIKRWTFGFQYDFSNNLKPKQAFVLGSTSITSAHGYAPFNVYFPIKYRVTMNENWILQPYVSPTINSPTINLTTDKIREPVLELSTFSASFGIQVNKIVAQQALVTQKQRARIMNSLLTLRLNINPIQFKSEYSSLNGTVLDFTIGFLFDSKSGKMPSR